ncbi:MAG: hypothetical protein AAGF24_13870, partial [Cyanobacteria bacterium P01_H01_bin.121]
SCGGSRMTITNNQSPGATSQVTAKITSQASKPMTLEEYLAYDNGTYTAQSFVENERLVSPSLSELALSAQQVLTAGM